MGSAGPPGSPKIVFHPSFVSHTSLSPLPLFVSRFGPRLSLARQPLCSPRASVGGPGSFLRKVALLRLPVCFCRHKFRFWPSFAVFCSVAEGRTPPRGGVFDPPVGFGSLGEDCAVDTPGRQWPFSRDIVLGRPKTPLQKPPTPGVVQKKPRRATGGGQTMPTLCPPVLPLVLPGRS